MLQSNARAESPDISYELEAAKGVEYRPGVASRIMSELREDHEFRVIAKGDHLLHADVTDLKPSWWYYWRLAIYYCGRRYTSAIISVATTATCPPAPLKPALDLRIRTSPGFAGPKHTFITMKFRWPQQQYLEPAIQKYQFQIEEKMLMPDKVGQINRFARLLSRSQLHPDGVGEDALMEHVEVRPWRTVYCDAFNTFKCKPPPAGCLEWKCRVRALNSSGWSPFSEILVLNSRTHSNLFPIGLRKDEDDAKLKARATEQFDLSSLSESQGNDEIDDKFDDEMNLVDLDADGVYSTRFKEVIR